MQVSSLDDLFAIWLPGILSFDDSSYLFYLLYRYEAALILRNKCLEEFALGDVLQILNMLSTMKKWIVNHQSGWQPIKITLAETNTDINTETSA